MHKFNNKWQQTKFSELVSSSDEGFAILLIENSEEKWTAEYNKMNQNVLINEADLPCCKYTSGGSNKKQLGVTRRHRGWTQEGVAKFNEIVQKVREDCIKNGNEFDKYMMETNKLSDTRKIHLECTPMQHEAVTDLFYDESLLLSNTNNNGAIVDTNDVVDSEETRLGTSGSEALLTMTGV